MAYQKPLALVLGVSEQNFITHVADYSSHKLNWINVISLGCVGDNSTDNSSFLDDVGGYDVLYFPAGSYKMSTPVLKSIMYKAKGEGVLIRNDTDENPLMMNVNFDIDLSKIDLDCPFYDMSLPSECIGTTRWFHDKEGWQFFNAINLTYTQWNVWGVITPIETEKVNLPSTVNLYVGNVHILGYDSVLKEWVKIPYCNEDGGCLYRYQMTDNYTDTLDPTKTDYGNYVKISTPKENLDEYVYHFWSKGIYIANFPNITKFLASFECWCDEDCDSMFSLNLGSDMRDGSTVHEICGSRSKLLRSFKRKAYITNCLESEYGTLYDNDTFKNGVESIVVVPDIKHYNDGMKTTPLFFDTITHLLHGPIYKDGLISSADDYAPISKTLVLDIGWTATSGHSIKIGEIAATSTQKMYVLFELTSLVGLSSYSKFVASISNGVFTFITHLARGITNFKEIRCVYTAATDLYEFFIYNRYGGLTYTLFNIKVSVLGTGLTPFNVADKTFLQSMTGTTYVAAGWFNKDYTGLTVYDNSFYAGAVVWDPASLDTMLGVTSADITITGAALGDSVMVYPPYDLQGITCSAYVSATDKVKIRLQNGTAGTIDLASGTWRVRVIK